ncbi:phage tail fiber assembly [Xenorhabdus mauleonii]|uniref:Phage tail fiber assembly n=1 Tax=Xenorhabdus mauleonii TaxID=351675 RepID=A0A1I3WQ77_9GAMM|nr:tail fiber assembly protein [Xenorhabdus mauleonii]PHM39253.1 phage tail fiber assembly [Xenorhabdus mauleonii]SFK09612.1 virus tail fibre assembly protein, lambda gpK [Xenorhabdus mauleonii]
MRNVNFVYSPSDNAIYPLELKPLYLNAGTWPNDTKPISDETAREFKNHAPDGKVMIAGGDGLPTWGDIPPPTPEQVQQQAEAEKLSLMSQATNAIAPLQYAVDLKMTTDGEQAALTAWKKYCVLLNRVDCSAAPDIDWPKAPE